MSNVIKQIKVGDQIYKIQDSVITENGTNFIFGAYDEEGFLTGSITVPEIQLYNGLNIKQQAGDKELTLSPYDGLTTKNTCEANIIIEGKQSGVYSDRALPNEFIEYFSVKEIVENKDIIDDETGEIVDIEAIVSHSLYFEGDAKIDGKLIATEIDGYATTKYVDDKIENLNFEEGKVVIGGGTASGENSTTIGSGSAEGDGSIVIGSGAAYSDNSVAIGANTKAGCKGFYFYSVTTPNEYGQSNIILSTSQTVYAWDNEAEEQYKKWQVGDKISYTNGTRYVLKSTIEERDYEGEDDRPRIIISDVPADFKKWTPNRELVHEDYSIVNPYHPEAGVIPFATGSFSVGENNSTTGTNSVALGYDNMAAAEYSYAEGYDNTAKGTASHAEGWQTTAGNHSAHAEGCYTTVNGAYGHAEGYNTVADKMYSHAEGCNSIAFGKYSHAEGGEGVAIQIYGDGNTKTYNLTANPTAIKVGQIIEYNNVYATITNYSRNSTPPTITVDTTLSAWEIVRPTDGTKNAIVLAPTASGLYSHAEGYCTVAAGNYSHAEGYCVRATGYYTHAEGTNTIANAHYSHAEGHDSQSQGVASHAQNKGTIAKGYATTAIGQYNNDSSTNSNTYASINNAFIIGNGTDSTSGRKNAFRVTFDGKTYGLSAFNSTGADYAEYFEWADKNPNAEDRIGRFVTITNGNQIALANIGDEILGVVSGHAAVLGDAYEDSWNGMYDRDIYGRLQYEEVEVEYEEEDEEGNLVTRTAIETHIKLNPNYDPTQTYIPRSERPEWAPVGLLGKLVVIDDGSCVPGGKCSCGINGTATASATGYHVLKRLDDTHIQILLK